MAKAKSAFFCQNCGAQSAKWIGKCPSCGEWNTYVEEILEKEDVNKKAWARDGFKKKAKATPLKEVEYKEESRLATPDTELNRVLGGGIVKGSLVLIGGDPGIGKSTLLLQTALLLQSHKVLYVSGEESEVQIKMRAERIHSGTGDLLLLADTQLDSIFNEVRRVNPDLLIIDSIQTLTSTHVDSAAGSVGQVRECTGELLKFAKISNTPVFLIGHITKEGTLAGPKVLEHMVDTVLQFEGDRHMTYRILRTIKNRFGSASELGIYEMRGSGLRAVENPSEILLSQRDNTLSGMAIGGTLEGNRPLLVEIQSLVSTATYGTPQRSATGFDAKRLNMLLAVLEKRGGFRLSSQDVFLNIAGGLRLEDPAIDLAVCVSLVSSYEEVSIPGDVCFAAEVGLGGEIRAVNRIESRMAEAEKLGFSSIYVSSLSLSSIDSARFKIAIHAFSKLEEVLKHIFQ